MSTTEPNGTQTAEPPRPKPKRAWELIWLVIVVAALIVGELVFQLAKFGQATHVWAQAWGVLRIVGIVLLILLLLVCMDRLVRRKLRPRPEKAPAGLYLVGALLGAVLLGPILGFAVAVIGAPGSEMNTTSGGTWAGFSMVLVTPAGALLGALVGAFSMRKLHVLYLAGAVLGEVLLGITGALLGRLIGSLLGEWRADLTGWVHGALAGAVLGVIAGTVYARIRLAKTGNATQDAESRDVGGETTRP